VTFLSGDVASFTFLPFAPAAASTARSRQRC
jgi:hypothetical protein